MNISKATSVCETTVRHPYYNGKFAWLPVGIYEKGDKHNSATIAARWLWFTIRDASTINLDLSLDIDSNGIHFRLGVPYVNLHFQIAFPQKWSTFNWKYLYRRGEESYFNWMK